MTEHGYVLLGLGDGHDGQRALDWAAHEAYARHTELQIVRAYDWATPLVPWESTIDRTISDTTRGAAHAHVRRVVTQVQKAVPGLTVRGEALQGVPAEVLLERSKNAALTVVGSRNLGVLGAAALGSVSTVLAARARGPVVVIEGAPGLPAEDPAVVVGVDGSPATEDVLEFAFDYASRHGRPLRAVYCWPADALAEARWRPSPPPPAEADRWLAEATAGWSEKYPDVAVHRSVIRSRPVPGLVAASLAQELLVVGSHSRHARVAAWLGSVSQSVLHHVACPVAVIHATTDED